MNALIGTRLYHLRTDRGMSQAAVASILGLKDRQSVQAMESGARAVKAEELLKLSEFFGVPMDFFADPFQLVQKADFFCRCHETVDESELSAFRDTFRAWIGAFRALALDTGTLPALLGRIGIDMRSSFEEADSVATRLARQRNSGQALVLSEIVENEFSTVVIMTNRDTRISSVACRTPDMYAVVLNAALPPDELDRELVHGLFRLLTWDSLPPSANTVSSGRRQEKAERLAARFSETFLGELRKAGALDNSVPFRPRLFSKRFLAPFAAAIADGKVSVRKAAGALGVTIDELKAMLASHGLEAAFDL